VDATTTHHNNSEYLRAASLAAQNRQARLVKELRTVRARMEPWRDMRAVRELDERLVEIGVSSKA
jgi:hypothetical protein